MKNERYIGERPNKGHRRVKYMGMPKQEIVCCETDKTICDTFHQYLKDRTAAMAFISPHIQYTISPSRRGNVGIDIMDELSVEETIYTLKQNNIENLYLVLNTFGGDVSSSFKVAYAIRKNFKDITVIVPQFSVSGGTLLALSGNKIVMGDMSSLSPIDVQMELGDDEMYSVNDMIRSFEVLNEMFAEVSEDDAPYPYKSLVEKFHPVVLQHWIDTANLMQEHAKTILNLNSSLKDKSDMIIKKLTGDFPTHQYSIVYDVAKDILGDAIIHSSEFKPPIWHISRKWIQRYIDKQQEHHFIRYILPKNENEGVKTNAEEVNNI